MFCSSIIYVNFISIIVSLKSEMIFQNISVIVISHTDKETLGVSCITNMVKI